MARADYRTQGLLNRWPVVMSQDMFLFNQIAGTGTVPTRSGWDRNIYLQYERDYIAAALNEATVKARDYCGFNPAPEWVLGEPLLINSDYAWNGQEYELQLGHVESVGKRAVTLLSAGVNVVYSDEDNDQIEETATVTIASALPTNEVQLFFRTADGATEAASEYWQIDGLKVTTNGTTVTFRGHKGLFAHPANVWSKSYQGDHSTKFAGDTGDVNAFVSAVDIYRVYSDPTQAVEITVNPNGLASGDEITYATAVITDKRYGNIRLYVDGSQEAPAGIPLGIRVWYKSGLPLVNGNMQAGIERALIRYANTVMPQQPALIEPLLDMWLEDRQYSKLLKMKVGSLAALTALKPIRMALKAKVQDWFPDAPPTDG